MCRAIRRLSNVEQVVDVPTRPGVSVRLLVGSEGDSRGTVLLFAGGHGGLGIFPGGTMRWGEGNFLVRSRRLFAAQGLRAVVVDAPSDRQSPPFLAGWRQRAEHVTDVRALIAWARETGSGPVWLAGTSRGTQSVGFVATELAEGGGPDGILLTATILVDPRDRAVPRMPVERLRIPVLVAHHEQDGCRLCPYHEAPRLMERLERAPRKALLSFTGGDDVGDPCEARAHLGFNGQEADVVARSVAWMMARP